MRVAFLLVAICGALACGIILRAYLTPMTGITGTAGAALAAFGGGMVALGGLLKAAVPGPSTLAALLSFLLFLGILGTGVAAWFLMQFVALGLMGLALVAWIAGASRVARLEPGAAA